MQDNTYEIGKINFNKNLQTSTFWFQNLTLPLIISCMAIESHSTSAPVFSSVKWQHYLCQRIVMIMNELIFSKSLEQSLNTVSII